MEGTRPLAVVTGASMGIGFELAKLAAQDGHDLLIAADRDVDQAVAELSTLGVHVEGIETDLSEFKNVEALHARTNGRPVALLFANAGHGLGHAFLDQKIDEWKHVIDTNITGTVFLLHRFGNDMRQRNAGKILITGSIAGLMPGSFQAVYNGTKAFVDSFAEAFRNELKDTAITVTCLQPGATETEFFDRADMMDTKVGVSDKEDPAATAKHGYDALMAGKDKVVSGFKNKLQAAATNLIPDSVLAGQHRKMAEPGSARG